MTMHARMALLVTPLLVTPLYGQKKCLQAAAMDFGIKPDVIQAISYVESHYNNNAINYNSDGSYDVCAMQVNSRNFAFIKRELGLTAQDLRNDICACFKAGALILSNMGKWAGTGLSSDTIAAYNAGVHPKRINSIGQAYLEKVRQAYRGIKEVRYKRQLALMQNTQAQE